MLKSYKYRLYPTVEQEIVMKAHFDGVRLVYNLAHEVRSYAYLSKKINISAYKLKSQLVELKNEFVWLMDVNAQSLQSSILNLESAYDRFFSGTAEFPVFKIKGGSQSFHCPQRVKVNFDLGHIRLSKFEGPIKAKFHRTFEGVVKSATITRRTTGKYFISILVNTPLSAPVPKSISRDTSIGIDLGIKTLAVLSDGIEYKNHKYYKSSLARLGILQKRASRKTKDSSNNVKANLKVAILHEKISNKRKDLNHKVSREIVNRYETIVMEDLAISNLTKNHNLALSIHDAAWGNLKKYIAYKSLWYGKNLITIDRFAPTSKLHNTCGHVNKKLLLSDRKWVCPNCGEMVERDKNAAINILNFGIKEYSGREPSEEPVESPALAGALKQENLKLTA